MERKWFKIKGLLGSGSQEVSTLRPRALPRVSDLSHGADRPVT